LTELSLQRKGLSETIDCEIVGSICAVSEQGNIGLSGKAKMEIFWNPERFWMA